MTKRPKERKESNEEKPLTILAYRGAVQILKLIKP